MSKHKALELAEKLRTRNGNASGFGLGQVCDEADATIRAQHALIVQMREALENAANGMAYLILEVAYKPNTPENIQKVKDAVVTQQPDGPFGDVMRALAAVDQYLEQQ